MHAGLARRCEPSNRAQVHGHWMKQEFAVSVCGSAFDQLTWVTGLEATSFGWPGRSSVDAASVSLWPVFHVTEVVSHKGRFARNWCWRRDRLVLIPAAVGAARVWGVHAS